MAQELTHPKREIETSLGNLIADAFAEVAACDVMLVGSGSIRRKRIGPIITMKELLSCFPYDDSLTRYSISGLKLRKIFSHIMRKENRNAEGECYQVNDKVKAIYSDKSQELDSIRIAGNKVSKTEFYTICIQGYHFRNAASYLNITPDELLESEKTKVITTSAQEILEEYLRNHQNIKQKVEGRLVYQ